MAKRQALLFELMKENAEPNAPKSIWDHLFRKKDAANQVLSTTHAEDQPAESQQSDPTAETSETEQTHPWAGETKIFLRVNTFSLVLAGVAVLVLFFCGYVLGHAIGYRAGNAQRSDSQLTEVREKTAEPAILEDLPGVIKPKKTDETPPSQSPSDKTTNISQNEEKISRKIGLNYLIIQVFEQKDLPIAERAKAFLEKKGIAATIEPPSARSSKYKLMSVDGFDFTKTQQKVNSIRYQEQIRAIGQLFRSEKDANGVDFKWCYYEKKIR